MKPYETKYTSHGTVTKNDITKLFNSIGERGLHVDICQRTSGIYFNYSPNIDKLSDAKRIAEIETSPNQNDETQHYIQVKIFSYLEINESLKQVISEFNDFIRDYNL